VENRRTDGHDETLYLPVYALGQNCRDERMNSECNCFMFSLFRIKYCRTSMIDKNKKKNQIQHNHTCIHRHPKLQIHPYTTTQIQPWGRLNFNYEQTN